MSDYKKAIGHKIQEYRASRKYSKERLGGKIGVHPHTISSYENGAMGDQLETFMKFCREVPGLVECLSAAVQTGEPEEQQLNQWWSALSLKEKENCKDFYEFEKRKRD